MYNKESDSQSLQLLYNPYFGADTAVVEETINGMHQKGRIKVPGGISWLALNYTNERILKGERVRLLGRQGNTWIVELIRIPGMAPRRSAACVDMQPYSVEDANQIKRPATADLAQMN
ncbi:NfeD family protein [Leptothoe kymatousa]|uniref:NfeD family protein n=1 Tax=Leptothoe kymatousa TAU-MAC 1615 TaxID=2364775 RepID=A0ABS5Y520_9CYAN|nr:NfeD family protein [Leptothoe kymatousa]MBT9312939.1 NfeD family protein [Leptothoe kymatousa TAU-MAC 1615]